jgi:hypothetical protein
MPQTNTMRNENSTPGKREKLLRWGACAPLFLFDDARSINTVELRDWVQAYWFQVRFAQPSQWSHWFRPDHGHTHCHLSFQRCQIFQFFSTIWLSGTSSVLLLDKEADRNIAWPHGNFIINNDDGVTRADKESSAIGEPQRTFSCRRMKQLLNEHMNDEKKKSIFCYLMEVPAADAMQHCGGWHVRWRIQRNMSCPSGVQKPMRRGILQC